MDFMSRLLSGLFLFTALLLTLASFSAEWLFEFCAITDQHGNHVSLSDLQRKGDRMTRDVQISLDRLGSKETAVGALIRGEMSLLEAAALFRSLYEDPKAWHHPLLPRPSREDGESWCRVVIEWTESKLRDEQSASQASAVRQRLEAELQSELASHGTVKLPE
jgi:hypothetical protein